MPRLTSLVGLAGERLSADRSALMADLAAGLFAEGNRQLADALASAIASTRSPIALGIADVEPGALDRIGPEHIARRDPCQN